ncbi:MAG: leucine-rich repeat domain-containing protein [Oribacterium sinus]|uniref:Leucine-rich repeat domain-containing protein n=1 Tax=Oribacterium sinus TaxID=237576 RepID=A0A930H2F5_9FIRM|nr:leucine-rich repeat domain-containing protein [Oribacterium sinus]
MKITKIQCPNCNGQLSVPEGMKEGFVQCEFCNTKVYLEPHKPDITQNITIKNVNYNKERTVPYNPQSSSIMRKCALGSAVVMISICVFFLLKTMLFSSHIELLTDQYRSTVQDPVVISFVEKAFSKNLSQITREDYSSLKFLSIAKDIAEENWCFSYAEKLDEEGNPVDEKTLYFPATKSIPRQELQPFTGLENLALGQDLNFDSDSQDNQDLKNLKDLKYFSAIGNNSEGFRELLLSLAKPEQILGLSGIYLRDDVVPYSISSDKTKDITDIFTPFSSLKSLSIRVDSDYEGGLLFLRHFPKLENLSLYTSADLAPLATLSNCKNLSLTGSSDTPLENISVLSGMPQIENLSLSHVLSVKDLNFTQNMPKLKSLGLESVPILSLDGLANHPSLNTLSIDSCYELTNGNAIAGLSALQSLHLGVLLYDFSLPDLQNLTALEEVLCNSRYLGHFSHMPSIKSLYCFLDGDEISAEPLRGMNSLSTLVVSGSMDYISNDWENILQDLPSLEKLSILGDPLYTLRDYRGLFSGVKVKELIFDKNVIGLAHTPQIPLSLSKMEDNNSTETLILTQAEIKNLDDDSDNFTANAKAFLSHFKAIKKLGLRGNKLESLDCLEGLSTLEELDISDNYITDISALRNLPNLKKVKLSGNSIVNMELLPDSVEIVD